MPGVDTSPQQLLWHLMQVSVLLGTLLDEGPLQGAIPGASPRAASPRAPEEVIMLEAGGLAASLRMSPDGVEAEATAHELCLQDLCSSGRGIAEPMLQRWAPSVPLCEYQELGLAGDGARVCLCSNAMSTPVNLHLCSLLALPQHSYDEPMLFVVLFVVLH